MAYLMSVLFCFCRPMGVGDARGIMASAGALQQLCSAAGYGQYGSCPGMLEGGFILLVCPSLGLGARGEGRVCRCLAAAPAPWEQRGYEHTLYVAVPTRACTRYMPLSLPASASVSDAERPLHGGPRPAGERLCPARGPPLG